MRRRVLLAVMFLLSAWPAQGAITRDQVSQNVCTGLSCSTTHIVSQANLEALVCINWFASNSRSASGVTIGGSGATLVTAIENSSCAGGRCGAELWHLYNPTTGSQTVTATMPVSANMIIGVSTFANVDSTTPLGTPQSTPGSSATPSLTLSTSAGDVVAGCLSIVNAGSSPGLTGGTLAFSQYDSGGFIQAAGGDLTASGTSTPFPWTYGSAQAFALVGVPLRAAGTGGGGGGFSTERLLWTDLSSGLRQETNTRVYWKHATQPSYQLLATLAPDSTTYPVVYTTETNRCYVVDQLNSAGISPLSNELCAFIAAPGPIRTTLTPPGHGGGASDE